MEKGLKNDIPLIAIILLPLIYAAYIWNQLPEKVPVHWNLSGEIDRYGSKMELLLIILLPLIIYIVFLVIPKIDPKNKLNKMGNKYQVIKAIMVTFLAVLAIFIIYSAKNHAVTNPNYIMLMIGILFIILGNYFKTIKANYFIGIRTPWTLENETVWKETHKLGGKMWFVGGFAIVLSSLIFSSKLNFTISFIIMGILIIVPVVYSYLKFNEIRKLG